MKKRRPLVEWVPSGGVPYCERGSASGAGASKKRWPGNGIRAEGETAEEGSGRENQSNREREMPRRDYNSSRAFHTSERSSMSRQARPEPCPRGTCPYTGTAAGGIVFIGQDEPESECRSGLGSLWSRGVDPRARLRVDFRGIRAAGPAMESGPFRQPSIAFARGFFLPPTRWRAGRPLAWKLLTRKRKMIYYIRVIIA